MKKILGIVLSLMLVLSMVGCESQEGYEARVVKAVQDKIETKWKNSVSYVNITDREWTYHKTDNGEEYVQMAGIFVNGYSVPIVTKIYVDTKDGYITRVVTDSNGQHYDDTLPKNENSKIDL